MRKWIFLVPSLLLALTADPVFCQKKSPDYRLVEAVVNNDLPGVKNALAQGADIHARLSRDFDIDLKLGAVKAFMLEECTPLHLAAFLGFQDMVELLIESGAKVDVLGKAQAPPLTYAAMEGHLEIARLLLKKGALVNLGKKYDLTPFSQASGYDMIKLLLDHGADVNETDKEGNTRLMDLTRLQLVRIQEIPDPEPSGEKPPPDAEEDEKDITGLLLDRKIDVNIKNREGDTALIMAVRTGKTDLAKRLLEHGADPLIENKRGITALDIAQEQNQREIVSLMLDAPGK